MKKYYKAIEEFHEKFEIKGTNNEEMGFRLNLLIEELGELAQAFTKGKSREAMVEENIDLLNLVLGNFVSMGVSIEDVENAFWKKHKKIMNRRKVKTSTGNYRVSEFRK
ncbi:pyrophosphatase [Patescibacteria group bacterium]